MPTYKDDPSFCTPTLSGEETDAIPPLQEALAALRRQWPVPGQEGKTTATKDKLLREEAAPLVYLYSAQPRPYR
jgi:hypothetical protein